MADYEDSTSCSSPQVLDILRETHAVAVECSAHLPKLTPAESGVLARIRRDRQQGFLPSLVEVDMLLVIVDWLTQGRPHA